MSNVCCKEFKGWIKSFTKIERVLAVLEAILLVLFVVLLILLILHLIVCSQPYVTSTAPPVTEHPAGDNITSSGSTGFVHTNVSKTTSSWTTTTAAPQTLPKACSWTPSAKTTAATHYYENDAYQASENKTTTLQHTTVTEHRSHNVTLVTTTMGVEDSDDLTEDGTTPELELIEELVFSDQSDDEDAEDEYQSYVVALVKVKSSKDAIFGCILTVVSELWTLTAASCIEAIEEMDSLDSFVIMERYGDSDGGLVRSVRDVRIHPLYEGRNRSYDLAALKSSGGLERGPGAALELASMLDYLLTTIGESFTILGYGPLRSPLRSMESGSWDRRLRRASVRRVPGHMCDPGAGAGAGAAAGGWALRHLQPGRAGAAPRCSAAALCCGPLHARGVPCNYCAGTPLVRRRRLYGIMADNSQCGLSCEPALYVNVADLADWIESVVRDE